MNKSRIIQSCLAIFILTFGSTACDPFVKKKSHHKSFKRYFTHGDPKQIIAEASLNPVSFFTRDNVGEYSDFNYFGGVFFGEKTQLTTSREQSVDLEEQEAANDGKDQDSVQSYGFENIDGGFAYLNKNNPNANFKLMFNDTDGVLDLKSFILAGKNHAVKPLHYSQNKDRSVFSVLIEGKDEDGKFILALYFTRNFKTLAFPADADQKFNFLLGPGIRASWSDEIQITLCGALSDSQKGLLRDNILKWQTEEGKIHDLEFKVDESLNYAPFSDVNERCIQIVDGFLFEDSTEYAVLGITIPVINKTTRSIVDGDIMISQKGLEKISRDAGTLSHRYEYTVLHEFGHFLGLDHEFDKGPDGQALDLSIMSYDPSITFITNHDRESIEALYKK